MPANHGGYRKNVTLPLLIKLQRHPLDKLIPIDELAAEMGEPPTRIRRALATMARRGQHVERLGDGLYCRIGGKPDLVAEARAKPSATVNVIEQAARRLAQPAAKPTILGPDADETTNAVLELLMGDTPIRARHLGAIEAWRAATRTLINTITQE